MQLPFTLSIVVVLMLATLGPAQLAAAQTQDSAQIQILTSALNPDARLTYTGHGFEPFEQTSVTVEDDQGHAQAALAPATADAYGDLNTVSIPTPSGLALGPHTLRITGLSSGRIGRATFQLQWQPPVVRLDVYTAKPTQAISFEGAGFVPGEEVDVRFESTTSTALATVNADNRGDIVARNVVVPMIGPGDYNLVFTGRRSEASVSVGFDVQGFHPWAVLGSYYVAPHSAVDISGEDFVPGETVLVYLNSQLSQPVAQATADADGHIQVRDAFTLPDLTGDNQVIFVGQQSNSPVTATFAAAPAPSSTP